MFTNFDCPYFIKIDVYPILFAAFAAVNVLCSLVILPLLLCLRRLAFTVMERLAPYRPSVPLQHLQLRRMAKLTSSKYNPEKKLNA